MSHVDYLCPACNARMGVGRGGLDPLDWVICQNCKRPIRFHYLLRDARVTLLEGGPGPSFPPGPTVMVYRTPLGTVSVNQEDGLLPFATIPSITAEAGSTIVVGVAFTEVGGMETIVTSVEWNGQAFEAAVGTGLTEEMRVTMFFLDVAIGGTSNLVIDFPDPEPPLSVAAFATKLVAMSVPSLDEASLGVASLDATDSLTITPALGPGVQPHEFYIAAIGTLGHQTNSPGSWDSGYSQGQRKGSVAGAGINPCTVSEGFKEYAVASDAPVTLSGFTAVAWAAGCLAGFKIA